MISGFVRATKSLTRDNRVFDLVSAAVSSSVARYPSAVSMPATIPVVIAALDLTRWLLLMVIFLFFYDPGFSDLDASRASGSFTERSVFMKATNASTSAGFRFLPYAGILPPP